MFILRIADTTDEKGFNTIEQAHLWGRDYVPAGTRFSVKDTASEAQTTLQGIGGKGLTPPPR